MLDPYRDGDCRHYLPSVSLPFLDNELWHTTVFFNFDEVQFIRFFFFFRFISGIVSENSLPNPRS